LTIDVTAGQPTFLEIGDGLLNGGLLCSSAKQKRQLLDIIAIRQPVCLCVPAPA